MKRKEKRTNRTLAFSFMALTFMAITACGDAGVGFNVSKAVPITIQADIPIPDRGNAEAVNDLLVVNPPSITLEYDISEIEAFESALDGLQGSESIIINSLAYEFSDISEEEEVDMDAMVITMETQRSSVDLLNVRRRLQNISRTPISLTDEQREDLASTIANAEPITANVLFDLSELPASADSIIFNYSLIFDITVRARDL
ncbi:MAG: hypothetical protein AAGA85_14790 [Bacteroidota bacterium]